MGKVLTLAKRELAAYFYSPVAYLVVALFLAVSGIVFFWRVFVPGQEASLRVLFEWMAYLMIPAIPWLTMRLMSEEYRSGTIETLMTAPVSDTQVILGKFLGVLGFYLVLLASTLVFLVLMAVYAAPDAGVAIMGYLGMILLGAAYLSVGVFSSTLTRHQLIAVLIAAGILGVFVLMTEQMVLTVEEPLRSVAGSLSVMSYFRDFSRGVFDTRGLVFLLTATVLFLYLSVKTLESRRWR